jgi:uroporphyrinogen decarboxylase
MDPAILRAKPEVIRGEVKRILGSFGENDGHVFNLGHGITPDINPDNAKIFIDAVHEFSSSN